MKSGIATFETIAELQRLAERAFVYKLKEERPDITPQEIEEEVGKWYKDRPGAEFGDGVGRVREWRKPK
ncbi:MAG: hypothetical protein LC113_00365 [Acidobacteria bacterium]|nr:hypothetical protein [Acidobacteriota bacterium]